MSVWRITGKIIRTTIMLTSRVIANIDPNFVAVATVVGRGKMRLAAFSGPALKTAP